jgi:mRNA-degrading endonuclease toxin of MazEF toxin-antitoxin module
MSKDFWQWHEQKTNIEQNKVRPFFHEREVWFSSLGTNVGYEQDGKGRRFLRPVVIMKKFNNEICWTLPLTRTHKEGKYYVRVAISGDSYVSVVILSQLRLCDAKRLQYKVGDISPQAFKEVKKHLKRLLD